MSDWSDPLWHQLYTSPHQQALLTGGAGGDAPQAAVEPAYLQILQQAAQQNVPLHQITLTGIDESARASS
jgi:hypothetical protein